MATLTNGPFQIGTASFVEISRTETDRLFVMDSSAVGKPQTLRVQRKVLPKTSSRPFGILQVSITATMPRTSTEDAAIMAVDNATFTFQLPLISATADLNGRLYTMIWRAIGYMVGGVDSSQSDALALAIGTLCADDWAIGLI